MADFDSSSFQIFHYEPGNPEFPTLPDGITSLHFAMAEAAPGLFIEAPIQEFFEGLSVGPSNDDQRFAGWHTDDTWYNPTRLDLGVISQPISRTINAHNTRRTPITVTGITTPEGITLDSPAPPVVIPSFESIVFTFDVSVVGPGEFESIITIETSEGDFDIIVTGTRVDIFEFVPELPFTETLTMRTEVKRSKDGTDQTISLVKAPKSTYDYRIANDEDIARITFRLQIMAGSSQLLAGGLKWTEARFIQTALLSSDTVLPVDTTNSTFEVGDNVSIVNLRGDFLVRGQIGSLTSSTITLDDPLGTDIPRNCVVVPFAYGYISRFPDYGVYPVNAEDVRVQFIFPDEPWLGATLPGSFNTLNSRPILEKQNIIAGQTKSTRVQREEYVLDSRLMNRSAFNRFPLSDEVQEYRASLKGNQELWDWRVLFHYLNGSWGTFYVPTFQNDLPGVTTSASTDFVAPDIGLANKFGAAPDEPRKYLRFEYSDGTIIYAAITNVVDGGTMTVDTPLQVGTPKISFVSLARIIGDTATFSFTGQAREAFFTFRYRTVNE